MRFTSSQLKALRNQFDKTSEDIGTRFVDGDMDLSTFVQVSAADAKADAVSQSHHCDRHAKLTYLFATFIPSPIFYRSHTAIV